MIVKYIIQDNANFFHLMYFNKKKQQTIPRALSIPRFNSYISATTNMNDALKLYEWNLELSASFIVPLHFYEVVLRNAVSEGISAVYSQNWHLDQNFIYSLDKNNIERLNIAIQTAKRSSSLANPTIGSVIAELSLFFWESLFKVSYGKIIWDYHLNNLFAFSPSVLHTSRKRQIIYDATKDIRFIRNRIAHHEPIFDTSKFNHNQILLDIDKIVNWRCKDTAIWLAERNKAFKLLLRRP